MMQLGQTVSTLGCEVHPITLEQAAEVVIDWIKEVRVAKHHGTQAPPCRYVVTPNLDHAVLLQGSAELRRAYQQAALVLADGMPLVWAAKLQGKLVPERVAGSDLGPLALQRAPAGTRVFFLGATDESSQQAVRNVRERFRHLDIVGRMSPPPGFELSSEWGEQIVQQIAESQADLILVGLGAPKQELWVHQHFERLPGTVVLCVGATIDFLAGTVERAPQWAQRVGAEWLHRLVSDPKRLAKRYGKDALHLPGLLMRDVLHRHQH